MKKYILILVALVIIAPQAFAQDETEFPEKTFTNVNEIYRTPVLSQGATGTCWSFSASSFWETELERLGKGEINISELFTVYHVYIEKARVYIKMHGNNTFAQGGFGHDFPFVYENFGAVPADVYSGLLEGDEGHNHGELARVLKAYLDALLASRRSAPSHKWMDGFKGILDAYIGTPPAEFEYEGKTYTPRSFADEKLDLNMDDYLQITSYKYLPWYEASEHVIPDNWMHCKCFYNLPLDEFMQVFDNALRNGYSVIVSSDVSEKYFSQKHGYAILERDLEGQKELVTQDEREEMWNNWKTTDDHGMHGVGVATDENGDTFYLVKNSWGVSERTGPYDGHIYMSENFLRAKMHTIYVHKDGVPAEILEKLKIK